MGDCMYFLISIKITYITQKCDNKNEYMDDENFYIYFAYIVNILNQ